MQCVGEWVHNACVCTLLLSMCVVVSDVYHLIFQHILIMVVVTLIFYVHVMKIQTIFSHLSLMSEVAFVDHHILVSSTQSLSLPSPSSIKCPNTYFS